MYEWHCAFQRVLRAGILSILCEAHATVLRLRRISRFAARTVAHLAAPCRAPRPHAAGVKFHVTLNAVRPNPNPTGHVRRLERQHPPGHARVTERARRALARLSGSVSVTTRWTPVVAARLAVDVADAQLIPRTRARRHCKGCFAHLSKDAMLGNLRFQISLKRTRTVCERKCVN